MGRSLLVFLPVFVACHAATPEPVAAATLTAAPAPWQAVCAAAATSTSLGALPKLPAQWTRLALIEGQWVTPPESGTLPPVEVESKGIVPVLHIRTGAGEKTHAIRGTASLADGSVGLLLVDDSGVAGACAAFVPWAASGLGGSPPPGAWVVVTPGSTASATVAWYPVGVSAPG